VDLRFLAAAGWDKTQTRWVMPAKHTVGVVAAGLLLLERTAMAVLALTALFTLWNFSNG
jgi:hypothetical protein